MCSCVYLYQPPFPWRTEIWGHPGAPRGGVEDFAGHMGEPHPFDADTERRVIAVQGQSQWEQQPPPQAHDAQLGVQGNRIEPRKP